MAHTLVSRGRTAVLVAGTAVALSACFGNPSPNMELGRSSSLAAGQAVLPDSEFAALFPVHVDSEFVAEANREAQQTVRAMTEQTQREFLRLFGPDPLGLARAPANAARYEIPLQTNQAVEGWIDYFRSEIPDRFATYLRRSGRYESMIRPKLRAAGLPQDLLYLAVIESGMNPNAYSRARAVGLWQFIAGTARKYGLEVDYWVDERRDPVASTDAAIKYLSDLYDEFGSWYLAAAAYNAGEGRVRRGIARTGSHSYWDLVDARVLHRQTRNYVPKLIAAALIGHDPSRYGFDDIEPESRVAYDTVDVPDATSFDVIAKAAGVSEDAVDDLNPEYLRHVTPPHRTSVVKVPVGHAERFASAYAQIPAAKRVTWLVHTVTRGQTLSGIAARYGTSVRAILAANRGVSPRRLQIGERLVVPREGVRAPVHLASARASRPSGPSTVVVRRGDTLWAIARRYNVSTRELMSWNGLRSASIHPGDRLEVRR
jgi:membrane-bound lytic murein transglycosylase D